MRATHAKVTLIGAVLCIPLLAGCASTAGTGPQGLTHSAHYEAELQEARRALVQGRVEESRAQLERAAQMAQQNGLSPARAQLLLAEVRLRQGDRIEAFNVAREALNGQGDDPRANEVMGKVLLADGRFAEAEERFATARAGYQLHSDVERVDDLLRLTRGLVAYSNADPQVARRYWRSIESPELRFELDRTRNEAIAGTTARR